MSSYLLNEVQNHFYTYAQATNALEVSKMTLWRWIKAGRVKVYRLGREVLIEKAVIDKLAKERAA